MSASSPQPSPPKEERESDAALFPLSSFGGEGWGEEADTLQGRTDCEWIVSLNPSTRSALELLDTATVAQIGNLLFRGLAIRRPAECHSAKQQITDLRYTGRLTIFGGSVKMHSGSVGVRRIA